MATRKPKIVVSGKEVRSLMAKNRVTVRAIVARFHLTTARVREVRKDGGPWDWPLIIETIVNERVSHAS
jgi:hypothetical protein